MFDNDDYIPLFNKIGRSKNWILYKYDSETAFIKEPLFSYMFVNKETKETIGCTIPAIEYLPEDERKTFVYLTRVEERD